MQSISTTDFLDVVSRTGASKVTKIREIKHRKPYSPAVDFYKPIRDHLISTHSNNLGKAHVSSILSNITDEKKIKAYDEIANGYTQWWGTKAIAYFNPPAGAFTFAGAPGFGINVYPELGLVINGTRHVVKLHLKADSLSKPRADIIHELMSTVLAPLLEPGDVMAVLDVRRHKLFIPTVSKSNLTIVLQSELAYIANTWPLV